MIEPYVYEIVKEKGGSISAEHGLGELWHSFRVLRSS